MDIDEAADGWQCPGSLGCADDLLTNDVETSLADVEPAEASSPVPGAEGWIVMPMQGMPLVMVIYLDDETACDLACGNLSSAVSNESVCKFAADEATVEAVDAEFIGCIIGPWPCGQALAGQFSALQVYSGDEMAWRDEAAISTAEVSNAPVTSEEMAIGAAAAFGGVPDSLVWSHAIEHSSRCEFAWGDCSVPSNPAIAVWGDDRSNLPLAEFCREAGRTAWHLIRFLNAGRDATIAAASRELVSWLPKIVQQAEHAANRNDLKGDRSTKSAIRVSGTLIAL
jgi:hypothetical protein